MYDSRIDGTPLFLLLLIIIILLVSIGVSPSSAQYIPWGINPNIYTYPYSQFGFGTSYGLFGASPYGQGYSSNNNIPIFSPFSRISINQENFYMPYGFGTTSASGALSRPYTFGGFGWRYPWRPW